LPNSPGERLRRASEDQQVVTKLRRWQVDATEYGVVGGAVGATFAVFAKGRTRQKPVVCLPHVTHAMATRPDDFEKGGHDGQEEALTVCARAFATAVAYARSGAAGRRER
jgi:hypothetical protein